MPNPNEIATITTAAGVYSYWKSISIERTIGETVSYMKFSAAEPGVGAGETPRQRLDGQHRQLGAGNVIRFRSAPSSAHPGAGGARHGGRHFLVPVKFGDAPADGGRINIGSRCWPLTPFASEAALPRVGGWPCRRGFFKTNT
jgi:hypothetical protein